MFHHLHEDFVVARRRRKKKNEKYGVWLIKMI
jgi:hypothetical protein